MATRQQLSASLENVSDITHKHTHCLCVRVRAKEMDLPMSSRSETELRQRSYLHTNAVGRTARVVNMRPL